MNVFITPQTEIVIPFLPNSGPQGKLWVSAARMKVFMAGRQSGKCLATSTLCMTPSGPREIQFFKAGDEIMGYNSDGTISPCRVVAVSDEGEKDVIDLTHRGVVYETCTLDHPWLVNYSTHPYKEDKVRAVKDWTNRDQTVRQVEVDLPLGPVGEPHAYAVAALLGDGCSTYGVNALHISGGDEPVVKKVAENLGCFYRKQAGGNFTWTLTNSVERYKHGFPVHCNHYDAWCRNRHAHEKTLDMDVIKSWDRDSCLAFLAGLLDTDGSVSCWQDRELSVSWGMQALPVIEAVQFLLLSLFQYTVNITVDNRDKYKNGPVYVVSLTNNRRGKRILKALAPFVQCERKQYKPEYEALNEYNSKGDHLGFKIANPHKAHCFNLQIDNETKLFLTAAGLVTHNSYLGLHEMFKFAISENDRQCMYVAQTNDRAKKIGFNSMMRLVPKTLIWEVNRSAGDMQITLINQSVMYFRSAEQRDNLARGEALHYVFADEVDFWHDGEYVWNSVLGPAMMRNNAYSFITSSPDRENGLISLLSGIAEEREDGIAVHGISADNPLNSSEFIEYQRSILDETTFRREYLGEAVGYAGLCMSRFNQHRHVIPESEMPAHDINYLYVAGLDYGVTDPTVVVYGFLDFAGKVYIYDEFHKTDQLTSEICADIKAHNFKKHLLWYDSANKGIGEEIKYRGLAAVEKATKDVRVGIQRVNEWFATDRLFISDRCEHLIHSLKNYMWATTKLGEPLDKPDHDSSDDSDSLRYLIHSLSLSDKATPPKPPVPWNSVAAMDEELEGKTHMKDILSQSEGV